MDMSLQDDVAFVTGGGQGVGRAICLALAAEGAAVAVNDLFSERCEAVATEIRDSGGKAVGVAGDITDHARVAEMTAEAAAALGPVSVLVNNAGMLAGNEGASFMHFDMFEDSRPEEWRKVVELNLFGALNCCHAVIPVMRERRRGRIVNIISEAARVGEPRLVAYAAAKGGVLSMTKSLAKELGRYGVTVNAVSLGTVDAEEGPLSELPEARQKAAGAYALARGLNRYVYARDVANAVVFLASERSEFTTGATLSVSGGYSIG